MFTGIVISRYDEEFSLTEAMALMRVRLSMPVQGTVKDLNGNTLKGINIQFRRIHNPEEYTDPINELLGIALGVR